jgi:hypothetical protein
MDLYRVYIPVSPVMEKYAGTPDEVPHPTAWEWDNGYLLLCLFASSIEDAVSRAGAIVEQLPYEMGEEVRCGLASDAARTKRDPEHKLIVEKEKCADACAREVGLGLFLHRADAGLVPSFSAPGE